MAQKKEVVSGSLDDLRIERSGVGDVNGKGRGSAARFNAGKMRYDLLDIGVLIESLKIELEDSLYLPVLESLSKWQHGGTSEDLLQSALTLSILTSSNRSENPACIGYVPWINVLKFLNMEPRNIQNGIGCV